MSGESFRTPKFKGVNHLALNTGDMKGTIEFYTQVLGMPLVHVLRTPAGMSRPPRNRGNPPYETVPHYFFDCGNDAVVAFFELPPEEAGMVDRNAIAAMQHCSFTVSQEQFDDLILRLEANGYEYLGPLAPYEDRTDILSIYFFDNNAIRLEATVHQSLGDGGTCVDDIRQTKSQARSELATVNDDPVWLERSLVAFDD